MLDITINDCNVFKKEELVNFDVYQFGVFNGGSMKEIASILNKHKIEVNCFYGFDVFTGMPKETAEPIFQESWDPDIMPDAFNAVKNMNLKTSEECAEFIEKEVKEIFNSKDNKSKVSVVSGLVEKTLSLQKELKKAFYVDFDLDIYSPTKYAFDYLIKNGLIVPGTIIGYDDWGGTPGFEEFKDGESRAHKEIVDEYGIKIEKIHQVGSTFPHVQTIWVVEGV